MSSDNYQVQKQQVMSLFKSAVGLAQKYGNQAQVIKNLQEASIYLENGKLLTVVCGEARQGKSSLINALLNEHNLFPVDVDITTCLVSSITYGKQEEINIYLEEKEGEKPRRKKIQRKDISSYVTEQANKHNNKKARALEIESPNPQLKEGLVLADTPGVGSLHKEHTSISYALVPNADVILFVSDVLAPLSAEELKFVEMINRHCQNFIFVVTKIDQKEEFEEVVENNRLKLAETINRPSEQITIIPVSSYLKDVYLQHNKAADLEESNFPVLEAQLWQLLNQQRGYILLMRSLNKLGQHVAEVRQPILNEWRAYQQQTEKERAEMEQKFQEARQKYQSLLDDNAQWITTLSDGMTDIRKDILFSRFDQKTSQVRSQVDKLLDDPRYLEEPGEIGKIIATDMSALVTDLGQDLLQQSESLQTKIETTSGLNLNPIETDPIIFDDDDFGNFEVPRADRKSGWWDKTVDVGRRAAFRSSGASFIGGIVGGLLGGTLGLLTGGIAAIPAAQMGASIGAGLLGLGSIPSSLQKGRREMIETEQKVTRQDVARILKPKIDEKLRDCRNSLEKGVTEVERCMRDDLRRKIRQAKDTAELALRSIKDARQLSQKQSAQKVAQLKGPLVELDQLLHQVEQLAKHIIAQHERGSDNSDYGSFADE